MVVPVGVSSRIGWIVKIGMYCLECVVAVRCRRDCRGSCCTVGADRLLR